MKGGRNASAAKVHSLCGSRKVVLPASGDLFLAGAGGFRRGTPTKAKVQRRPILDRARLSDGEPEMMQAIKLELTGRVRCCALP